MLLTRLVLKDSTFSTTANNNAADKVGIVHRLLG